MEKNLSKRLKNKCLDKIDYLHLIKILTTKIQI